MSNSSKLTRLNWLLEQPLSERALYDSAKLALEVADEDGERSLCLRLLAWGYQFLAQGWAGLPVNAVAVAEIESQLRPAVRQAMASPRNLDALDELADRLYKAQRTAVSSG